MTKTPETPKTAIVWPIIKGKIVDDLDQVLITDLSLSVFCFSTFLSKLSAIKGAFFSERPMIMK